MGVDRIIAEAGVAKMTLYTHFRSKDELILAVLAHREECVTEFFRLAMERHHPKAKSPLRAFFVALKEWFESPEFRGCAFQNAAIELADPATPAPSLSVDTSGASASSCVAWSSSRSARGRQGSLPPLSCWSKEPSSRPRSKESRTQPTWPATPL